MPHKPAAAKIQIIDALRGLAALIVVAGHARWLLWTGYSNFVNEHGRGMDLATLTAVGSGIFTYGHQAVIIFFVISGFAIHSREAKRLARGTSTGSVGWGAYALRRLRRLWPPLAFALVLTALLDMIGTRINPGFYEGLTNYPTINEAMATANRSVGAFAGGLLFLGGVFLDVFGSNGPLWSLGYEAVYYAAYPMFFFATRRFGARIALLAAGFVSVLACFGTARADFAVLDVIARWVVWCLGAYLAELYWGRARLAMPNLLAIGAGLTALGAVMIGIPFGSVANHAVTDLFWGAGAFLLILGLLRVSSTSTLPRPVNALVRLFAWFGDFSYTIYVVHFPIIVLLSAIWLSEREQLPLTLWLAAAGMVLSVAVAWLASFVVERPFTRFAPAERPERTHAAVMVAPDASNSR